uniref:Uncharacterized protein n=1 Tax=Desertifilum tharense IPPAS B-1220 TaxID=1781255 RepID=A0ACD5GVD4_9CYAN
MVIDRGEAIAEGTADELKDRVGGTYCEIRLADPRDEAKVRQELGELHQCPADGTLALPAPDRVATLIDVVRRMDAIGVTLVDISLRR